MASPVIQFHDRSDREAVESGDKFAPKFDEAGLIPAIAIDANTHEVLMTAYMNEESLRQTLEIGQAVYWSRSRKEIWHKGATSGQFQEIKEIRVDCDQDCLLLFVDQKGGGACHTGHRSCYFRSVPFGANAGGPLTMIE